jgi:hypothetical protein
VCDTIDKGEEKKIIKKMFVWSGNKMLSIEFLMLLILLLVIKTINASTLPSSSSATLSLNELSSNNKCEQISITNCPELKYNQTMISNDPTDAIGQMDIADANEMVS